MKKTLVLITVILITGWQSNAQVIITSGDMPVPGDTVRKSFTAVLDGIDYEQAGPDQTWYFDGLTVMSQTVDTFVDVSETPTVYQFFFNNQFIYPDYKATVALKMAEFSAIPGLTLTDAYQFMKNTSQEIREVGYGATLDGVQIPIQLQNIDTIYRFPLEYGNIDSAHSLLEVDVPDLGYLMVSKFRRNTVDGWGTLITPYGEFQTLRVKTEINEYDSVFSDSLGVGMPLLRNVTEYKWLANGYPEPILVVSAEPFYATATYIDSVRSDFLATPEIKKSDFRFSVYPNPVNNYLSIEYELDKKSAVQITLLSVYGSELKQFISCRQDQGYYKQVLYLKEQGVPAGIYMLRLTIDNIPYIRKIIVE